MQELMKRLAAKQAAAHLLDNSEYPTRWRDYIGQEPAVQMLKDAAISARIRREPLDHILISHPTPGVGKTALASLVAHELGRPARIVSGKVSAQKARMMFAQMQDRDVLVYDEFHQVAKGNKVDAEWMLHYLQDNTLLGPRGAEVQPRITVIAATTHPQKVPSAVIDRFMLVPPMQDYDTDEAGRIAILMSKTVLGDLPRLTKRDAEALAAAAGNNPRAVKKLLIALRDVTYAKSLPLKNGKYDIPGLLKRQGITEDGLDINAQRYLIALGLDFDGQAGVKALEDRLQQAGGLVDVERLLMDKGLVIRTRTGRALSQAGIARYTDLAG